MTTLRTLALATLTFAATGCAHKVPVSYLEAGRIDIDPEIQNVLIVDRSRARGIEHVLNGAEGVATGESYRLDADSAAIALETLEDVLEDGQRFEIVDFHVDGRAVDTSMWDRELAARKVRQLCRRAKCDAIIALDGFDSDTFTSVERDVDREEREVDYEATQSTDVVATFRLYDGRSGQVLDEQRMTTGSDHTSGSEDTAQEAAEELPYELAVFDGAAALGADYAARISPHTVVDVRSIYSGGDPRMRKARRAAKRGDLRTAARLWQEVARNAEDKVAAKALYNLAVAAESNGNLDRAERLAGRAAAKGGKNRMHRYVAILADRQDNAQDVARQLGTKVAHN